MEEEATRASHPPSTLCRLHTHCYYYYLPHEDRRGGSFDNDAHTCVYGYIQRAKSQDQKRVEEKTVGIIIRRRETNPSLESRETEEMRRHGAALICSLNSPLCRRPIVNIKPPVL
jgi:hypothetical protein